MFIFEMKIDSADIINTHNNVFLSQHRSQTYCRKSSDIDEYLHANLAKYVQLFTLIPNLC